jgi:hypothetical protein
MTVDPAVLFFAAVATFAIGYIVGHRPPPPRPAADAAVVAALLWGHLERHVVPPPRSRIDSEAPG